MQSLDPAAAEYEPAGQDEHTDVPFEVVYFPDSQSVHALDPPVSEYEPVGHCAHTAIASLEYVPAGQLEHTELPLEVLYVPAGHALHPRTGQLRNGHGAQVPVKPALQIQDPNAVLETGEVELAGQDEHADVPLEFVYFPDSQFVHALDPAAAEYSPAGQLEHTELPLEVLYVPAGHALHPRTGQTPSIPATLTSLIRSISDDWEMCRYRPVSGVGHDTL